MKKAPIILINLSVLLSLLITGCFKNNTVDKVTLAETYLVDEDTLANIISEMALTESALNQNIQNFSAAKFDSVYNFNPLLTHNVSKVRYDSTLFYYSKHPDEYKLLYELVLEKLNLKK